MTNQSPISAKNFFVALGASVIMTAFFVVGFLAASAQKGPNADVASTLPLLLKADTASSGKFISLATARVDEDVEAIYVMDHVAKNVLCFVINPRTGQQVGTYAANLNNFFAANQQAELDFSIVTGYMNANEAGRTGQGRATESACYVVEGNSGIILGFNFVYNQTMLKNNVVQQGQLNLFWQGLIRDPALNPKPAKANEAAPDKKAPDKNAPAKGEAPAKDGDPAAAANENKKEK